MQTQINNTKSQAAVVATKFLSAVQQRDRETVISLLHTDIKWSQPGNNRISGFKNSAVELMQMSTDMAACAEQSLTLTHFDILAGNGNSVVCLLHWIAETPSGKKLDVENIDIYEIVDGLLTQGAVYTNDVDQENAFFQLN
jgi:uncharacterized protein